MGKPGCRKTRPRPRDARCAHEALVGDPAAPWPACTTRLKQSRKLQGALAPFPLESRGSGHRRLDQRIVAADDHWALQAVALART